MKKISFWAPLALVALWWFLSSTGMVSPGRLPSPIEVAEGLHDLAATGMPPGCTLAMHVTASLQLVGSGFLLAILTAMPLGLLLGSNRPLCRALHPIVEFFRPIPPLAWVPLSVLWFGIGFGSAVFLIFLGAFFPILLNTISGVANVPQEYVGVARTFGAGRREIWLKVLLPGSLPSVLTGMRIGLGIAWMTLVAAEFTGSSTNGGLGYMIMAARDLQRTDMIMAGMSVIGGIGIIMEWLVAYIEKCILRWN